MRPRAPPPHVRPPAPSPTAHNNLITLTQSQNLKKLDATADEKVEEATKTGPEKPVKTVTDKDKLYNSLDLPQHRYCKVTANSKEPEQEKTEGNAQLITVPIILNALYTYFLEITAENGTTL